jgi:drug/metabolite transporter, DME family
MTVQQQGYATGVAFVLIATLGWSLSGVFVRFMPGLSGWQINCWRGYWVGISLLVYLVAVYGRDTPAKFRAIPLLGLLTSAGFFTLGSTLYVTSLTLVSTATISVIGASSPIFTGLLSPWITGEKPGLAAWAAALMAMAGVGIIAWHGFEAGNLVGMLVSLMVPICFAGQTLALRRFRHIDMVPAICVGGFSSFLVAGFFGMIGVIGGSPGGGFAVGPREVGLLALMGLLQLAIPLIFYVKGARSVPAITLSLIVMLDAVINPLWPWLALGEMPGRTDFIGGAVIIAAVVISIFGSRWNRR